MSLAPGVFVREDLLRCTFVASSGPGGQNVNKRSTKAQLRVFVDDLALNERARRRFVRLAGSSINSEGEVVLQSDGSRSQAQNKKACIDKLRELVLRAVIEPKKRRATKPTKGSIERRISAKKRRGEQKRQRREPDQ
ncbi:MAG: aminoacyl-tRNA hydrolase [Phycisphaerales bacterium]|nr:aminoacyl-tRNA hydrolase [Phycisphaerales bacterium]